MKDVIEQAEGYINADPKSSLTKSRMALESILLKVYIKEIGMESKKIELGIISSSES